MGNSKVDADNSSSGLRGEMGSCRHMAVGRCGSNRSISSSRCGSNRSSSSSSSNMFIDSSSISNRISSNTFGHGSSYYSLTILLIMHRPNGGSGGAFECGSNARGWYQEESPPRPTLRWAAYTSASGVEDSGIWPRFVPFYSGSKVHATAVASMITATTTASPTSTTHTPMTTSLAI